MEQRKSKWWPRHLMTRRLLDLVPRLDGLTSAVECVECCVSAWVHSTHSKRAGMHLRRGQSVLALRRRNGERPAGHTTGASRRRWRRGQRGRGALRGIGSGDGIAR
jgi:hypothetical protein